VPEEIVTQFIPEVPHRLLQQHHSQSTANPTQTQKINTAHSGSFHTANF